MRSRGWSQYRIAAELGLTQGGVSRLLSRVERRELRRLSASVERLKVIQDAQLGHVIEESLDAWHRSKTPKKRAARKTAVGAVDEKGQGVGDEAVETTEIVERDGETGYLYAAMQALAHQRSLWGLDVMAAVQDPAGTIAKMAQDIFGRASAYEQRVETQASEAGDTGGTPETDPGRVAEVPGGLQPVQ